MRVIHVVPSIANQASGPSYSVVRLCESLIACGEDVRLAALDWAPMSTPPRFLEAFPLGLGPRRLGRSPAMRRWLNDQVASKAVDLLHNHGMWQMNAIYPGSAAKTGRMNLVVSPRGALSERAFAHGSIAKRVFWPVLQRRALEQATCFHATAETEYEDIRRRGFRQPVAVIPNGVDIPALNTRKHTSSRTLLFLGRIHPIKGLDLLLRAWQHVQDRFPEWQIKIAGKDDGYHGATGYLKELQSMTQVLRLKRVEFVGELFGAEKAKAYQDADLFVLPTHSENFGMSVAEALAAGTPAVVSRGAPWEGLASLNSGWWIDIGCDALTQCLEDALSRSRSDLEAMGLRGRHWMELEYSWGRIGAQMADTYRWLLEGATSAPSWVRTT